jgi:hypothetical protein
MLAVYFDRAIFSDLSLLWIRLLHLAPVFKFDLFDLASYYLLNKLMSFVIAHLLIVGLAIGRKNDIALFWAGCVLDVIAAGNALSVFNHMMLGRRILHVNQTPSWRDLLGVEELGLGLIIILLLEGVEKVVCRVLGSLDFLHLLPDLFNVQVHDLVLILHIEARTTVT